MYPKVTACMTRTRSPQASPQRNGLPKLDLKLRLDEPVDLKTIKLLFSDTEGGTPLMNSISEYVQEAMSKTIGCFRTEYGFDAEMWYSRNLCMEWTCRRALSGKTLVL